MAQGSIVCEWLRSLPGLCQYTEAFLDNGYDDLEVCKQIGEPDLDAIGVDDPSHRSTVLEAVGTLREQGGAHVYFTLEETRTGWPASERTDSSQPPLAFPAAQLRGLVADKLREEGINLKTPPYTAKQENENAVMVDEHMHNLAELYAEDLCTYTDDVLEALQQLWSSASTQSTHNQLGCITYEDPGDFLSEYSPPNLSPVRSPRHGLTADVSLSSPQLPPRRRPSDHVPPVIEELCGKEGEQQKKTSTLSRLLRSVKLRHSGRKYTYRPHEGDLSATEMTMSDDDRIQLMILVKEGKISMEQAVETVKHFERRRRLHKSDADSATGSFTSDDLSHTPDTSSLGEDSPQLCLSPELPPRNPSHCPDKKSGKSLISSKGASPARDAQPRGRHETRTESWREKKRGIFSSPFSKRKGSADSKMKINGSGEITPHLSPKPSTHRERKRFSPRDALPPLPPLSLRSPSAVSHLVQSSSFQHPPHPLSDRSRVINMLYGYRRSSSDGPLPLPLRSPGASRRNVPRRSDCDYENLKYLSRSDTDLGFERVLVDRSRGPLATETHNCGSDTGLYCHASPLSRLYDLEPHIHISNISIENSDPDQYDDVAWIHPPAWRDMFCTRTSKRHTPPNGTPPDTHSPKRPHVHGRSVSTDSSYVSHSDVDTLKCHRDTDNSYTDVPADPIDDGKSMEDNLASSGLECKDKTESRSSSSTMSLVSENSPTTTLEAGPVKHGKSSKLSQIPRRRASSFSTGDEAMSSDSEAGIARSKNNTCGRNSKIQNHDTSKTHKGSPSGKPYLGESVVRRSKSPEIVTRVPSSSTESMSAHLAGPLTSSSSSPSSLSLDEDLHGPLFGKARALVDSAVADSDEMLAYKVGDILLVLSDPASGRAKCVLHNKAGLVSMTNVEMLAVDELVAARYSRQKKHNRRSRPRTVEDLLVRLNLQHLVERFTSYSSLLEFSQLEEEDLNELHIDDPEARTKLLTAAQMLLDQDNVDDSSSLGNVSSYSNNSQSSMISEPSEQTLFNGSPPNSLEHSQAHKTPATSMDASCHPCRSVVSSSKSPEHICDKISVSRHETSNNARKCITLTTFKTQPPPSSPQGLYSLLQNGHISPQEQRMTTGQHIIRSVSDSSQASQDSTKVSDRPGNTEGQTQIAKTAVCCEQSHQDHTNVSTLTVGCKKSFKTFSALKPQPSKSPPDVFTNPSYPRSSSFIKPRAPQRTVSLTDGYALSTSCPSTPTHVALKDAGTQHGSCLARLKSRTPSPSQLTKYSLTSQSQPTKHSQSSSATSLQAQNGRLIKTPVVLSQVQRQPASSVRSKLPTSTSKRPVGSAESGGHVIRSRRASQEVLVMVRAKLKEEVIDLTRPPYSDGSGRCGIPVSLVLRYAYELCLDVRGTSRCMEKHRITQLLSANLNAVECKTFEEQCIGKIHQPPDIKATSLNEFLISVGLPMYTDGLIHYGIDNLARLTRTSPNSLKDAGVTDPTHQQMILRGLEKMANTTSKIATKDSDCQSHGRDVNGCTTTVHVIDKV